MTTGVNDKVAVVTRLLGGAEIDALCREYGIDRDVIEEWRQAYRKGGEAALGLGLSAEEQLAVRDEAAAEVDRRLRWLGITTLGVVVIGLFAMAAMGISGIEAMTEREARRIRDQLKVDELQQAAGRVQEGVRSIFEELDGLRAREESAETALRDAEALLGKIRDDPSFDAARIRELLSQFPDVAGVLARLTTAERQLNDLEERLRTLLDRPWRELGKGEGFFDPRREYRVAYGDAKLYPTGISRESFSGPFSGTNQFEVKAVPGSPTGFVLYVDGADRGAAVVEERRATFANAW